MKIKKGFILRDVAGEKIIVATGDAASSFNGIINLNDTGAFIFSCLSKHNLTEDELAEKVAAEYGIDKESAKRDFAGFLDTLRKASCLE